MQCDSGKYNSLATLFLQSPERTVKNLLHAPIGKKFNPKYFFQILLSNRFPIFEEVSVYTAFFCE